MPGLVASERLSTLCPIDLETFPFWASLSSGFGWFCMTTPQRTFSCLVHSHFPGRSGCPVRPSRLFFPLSTRVYQAHAEGRGCLPFTREAGVDVDTASRIIDLHGYAVTKIKRLSPLSPHPCERFRANRSHTKRQADGRGYLPRFQVFCALAFSRSPPALAAKTNRWAVHAVRARVDLKSLQRAADRTAPGWSVRCDTSTTVVIIHGIIIFLTKQRSDDTNGRRSTRQH